MKHNYRLMVPTTIFDRPAPAALIEAVRREVKTTLAREFGGYTEFPGNGGYVSEAGELIEEPVFAIEAACDQFNDELVWALAERIKSALSQECVMIRKDDEVHFV